MIIRESVLGLKLCARHCGYGWCWGEQGGSWGGLYWPYWWRGKLGIDINSLAPGRYGICFKNMDFKLGTRCEIFLRWMPPSFSDEKSTLVQVMAWCHQVTSHYQNGCWLGSVAPYGVTGPQWGNVLTYLWLNLSLDITDDPAYLTLLTYCGLVTPYGDTNLGQHWLR